MTNRDLDVKGHRMPTPPDPNELRQLESEAHACERSGDTLGALDIYEEIVRRGWAGARHLAALGYCYINNRQRQNAKEIWLRGIDLDPGNKLCSEALDKYFPGWQQPKTGPRLERQKEMPPPPPPPPAGFGQELTVETISPASTQSRPAGAPLARPAEAPRPQPQPAPRPAPAAQPAAAAVARPPLRGPSAGDAGDLKINWEFVMADVAEEAALAKRR